MTAIPSDTTSPVTPAPTRAEARKVWARIGLLSFGGPAAQIALMHRLLVEEKGWLDERRFLAALSFCMLLPGPEAMQLATYAGWRLQGVRGGLVAGLLFVLPGALVVLALAIVYATLGGTGIVETLFFGARAAVLVIVIQALLRVARRALSSGTHRWIAAFAFVALFFLSLPYPLVILVAALIGFAARPSDTTDTIDTTNTTITANTAENTDTTDTTDTNDDTDDTDITDTTKRADAADAADPADAAATAATAVPMSGSPAATPMRTPATATGGDASTQFTATLRTVSTWLVIWWLPVFILDAVTAPDILGELARFFSTLAVVTFGGAYAVLAYLAQDVVTQFGWLTSAEVLDALALAETTPGPLILVTEFVGFLAAFRDGGITLGLMGAAVTLWVTFVPCFLWIFAGAPYLDALSARPRLTGALAAITAAVVGVMLNLSLWFALHVLFTTVQAVDVGLLTLWVPQWPSVDWRALVIVALCAALVFKYEWGIVRLLALATVVGVALLVV